MSFLVPELITTVILQNKMEFLSKNPDHLNWMLSPFVTNRDVANLVGSQYVKQCVEYITNNKINIRPANEADIGKLPSIAIMSYQNESQQFVGDYGASMEQCNIHEYAPETIHTFDVISYSGDTIKAAKGQGTFEKIWPRLHAKQGDFVSRILQLHETDTEVVITMEDNIPVGTPYKGWQAVTSKTHKFYDIGASLESVKVNVTLTTAGDYSLHRILVVLLRYCLKSSRLQFETMGLQTPTFSQQPVILVDDTQMIWQTPFMIQAVTADYWINGEDLSNDSAQLNITMTPERQTF